MAKKILGPIFIIIIFIYFVTIVLHISAYVDDYQWDFRTHREAGKIFASGSDPYDSEVLFPRARTHFLYTYPPVTLFLYQLFSMTDYTTAFHAFLILKCILLIGLVYFWKREFLKDDADPFFFLFCLLAFNSAVFLDLIAGNINLVEQVFLWLAFSFYIKERQVLFSVFVLLAASFKMTPAFFLILLLLWDDPKRYKYFLISAGAFLAYLLVQYIIVPEFFTQFIRNALTVVGEKGGVVPATSKLIGDLFQVIGQISGTAIPGVVQTAVIGIIAAGVIYLTYQAYLRLNRIETTDRKMITVFLVCLLYALIHPRFKDYAFLLLIVPSYYAIKNIRYTKVAPFLFILFILSSDRMELPVASSIMSFIWAYYPLLVAYAVWGILINEIFAAAREGDEEIEGKKVRGSEGEKKIEGKKVRKR